MTILITAGIEGGSRRTIMEEWGWPDWMATCRAWERTAPPAHILLRQIAHGLGVTPAKGGNSGPSAPGETVMDATPESVGFAIGQAGEIPIYQPPSRGIVGAKP